MATFTSESTNERLSKALHRLPTNAIYICWNVTIHIYIGTNVNKARMNLGGTLDS